MARGKVNLQRIQNPLNRRVTFSKRKAGLLKKAKEISTLCDAEIGLTIFSPTGKLYEFASPSMSRIIGKYQKGCVSTGCRIQLPPDYVEILRLEWEDLRKEIAHSETVCKHIVGEDLHLLNFRQLRQLEKKISLSVRKIRSRKDKILLENVQSLKVKEKLLRLENAGLDKKIGGNHEECHLNIHMMEQVNDKLETEAASQKDCLKLTLISRHFHDDNIC